MKIELHEAEPAERVTIEAFADKHDLVMVVRERAGETGSGRYYAHFKSAETRVGKCMLLGSYGNGSTPEDAIEDYARDISGKLLIVDAMSPNRREIQAPRFVG